MVTQPPTIAVRPHSARSPRGGARLFAIYVRQPGDGGHIAHWLDDQLDGATIFGSVPLLQIQRRRPLAAAFAAGSTWGFCVDRRLEPYRLGRDPIGWSPYARRGTRDEAVGMEVVC